MDPTSTGASGRRIRVLGILVGACLLVIAAALAILPITVEVAGSTANCGVPAFALRAPSEPDDKGFNAVDDACSGAGFGRLFKAFVFGGAGVAAIISAQHLAVDEPLASRSWIDPESWSRHVKQSIAPPCRLGPAGGV